MKFLALDFEFEQSEGIDNLFRDLPYDFHGPLGVDDVEREETALEVVLQRLRHRLYQLGRHLSHSHALEINDRYPVLDLARDQSTGYHVLSHVCRHVDESVMIGLDPLEFVDVDIAYRSHFSVSFEHVGVSFVQLLQPYSEHRDLYRERLRELVVTDY